MRKIFLTFSVLIAFFVGYGQNTMLTYSELYDGIKFNNVTLRSIFATKGDLAQMQALFGNGIQERPNNTGPFPGKELYNDNINFLFEDESGTGDDYTLTMIEVTNSNIVTKVKGLSIRIGVDKSKFGNIIMNAKSRSYNFVDADTGTASLSFYIDPRTNKVRAIEFILF